MNEVHESGRYLGFEEGSLDFLLNVMESSYRVWKNDKLDLFVKRSFWLLNRDLFVGYKGSKGKKLVEHLEAMKQSRKETVVPVKDGGWRK